MSFRQVPFSEAFEVVPDRGLRVAAGAYLDTGSLAVVDQGDGLLGGYTNDMALAVSHPPPLIVFGDHTRRIKFVDFPFAVGAQGVKILGVRQGLLPRFAYLALLATSLPDRGYGRHFALLRSIDVPVPSLPEQRRIVAILEEQLSALDDAARSLTSARGRSEALWISALRRARETAQKHGALSSIGQLGHTSLGKMLDAKRQVGELTPYLRNINVRWGRIDLDDLQTTALTDADRDRLVLEEGDLLVCEGGEPGRCAVWSHPESGIAFQKALHRVRIADRRRLTPEFLAAMIEEGIRAGRWERFFTGTTIKHLPQQQLRRLEVPVPPLQLQEGLVAQLSEQRGSLDRLREQVALAERREQSLRQAVLAAAFSGRLTGQWSDTGVLEGQAEQETA